jgi:hypothetical protein
MGHIWVPTLLQMHPPPPQITLLTQYKRPFEPGFLPAGKLAWEHVEVSGRGKRRDPGKQTRAYSKELLSQVLLAWKKPCTAGPSLSRNQSQEQKQSATPCPTHLWQSLDNDLRK